MAMSLSHPPVPGGSTQYMLFADGLSRPENPIYRQLSETEINWSTEDIPMGTGEHGSGSTVVCVT